MKDLFLALQNTIIQHPDIKHVDFDTGQLDQYGGRAPVLFPCVLIDIQEQGNQDLVESGKLQQKQVIVNLRLAFDFSAHTDSSTTEEHREKALHFLDVVEGVYDMLQGHRPTDENINFLGGYQHFTNIGKSTERRPDRYKVINMPFTTIANG